MPLSRDELLLLKAIMTGPRSIDSSLPQSRERVYFLGMRKELLLPTKQIDKPPPGQHRAPSDSAAAPRPCPTPHRCKDCGGTDINQRHRLATCRSRRGQCA